MLFLKPTMDQRETSSNYDPLPRTDEEDVETGNKFETSSDTVEASKDDQQQSISTVGKERKNKSKTGGRNMSFEESLLQILEERKKEGDDEDKMFLYSLLPSIKPLNPRKKLKLKIDFLKCIEEAMEPEQATDLPH